jgi:hypothetical protein
MFREDMKAGIGRFRAGWRGGSSLRRRHCAPRLHLMPSGSESEVIADFRSARSEAVNLPLSETSQVTVVEAQSLRSHRSSRQSQAETDSSSLELSEAHSPCSYKLGCRVEPLHDFSLRWMISPVVQVVLNQIALNRVFVTTGPCSSFITTNLNQAAQLVVQARPPRSGSMTLGSIFPCRTLELTPSPLLSQQGSFNLNQGTVRLAHWRSRSG